MSKQVISHPDKPQRFKGNIITNIEKVHGFFSRLNGVFQFNACVTPKEFFKAKPNYEPMIGSQFSPYTFECANKDFILFVKPFIDEINLLLHQTNGIITAIYENKNILNLTEEIDSVSNKSSQLYQRFASSFDSEKMATLTEEELPFIHSYHNALTALRKVQLFMTSLSGRATVELCSKASQEITNCAAGKKPLNSDMLETLKTSPYEDIYKICLGQLRLDSLTLLEWYEGKIISLT